MRSLHGLMVLFMILGVSCLLLCSCAEETVTDTGEISFTDALGRTVVLDSIPQRTASLSGSLAEIWMLAGGTLCAAAEDAWDDVSLELGDALCIGGAHSPNMELLIAADPDFVIASASTASHVELLDVLTAVGITVAYFEVECFDDYLGMLSVCTGITGQSDLYERNGTALQEQINAVKQQYQHRDIPEQQRRILLLRAASNVVKAKGSDGTVLGEMLHDIGCINIADSDTSLLENLSAEAVIALEPHHIFVVTMGSDADAAIASVSALIEGNPAWNTLDAVRNNRLHMMDRTLFHLKPNERWAEAYRILYETLTK